MQQGFSHFSMVSRDLNKIVSFDIWSHNVFLFQTREKAFLIGLALPYQRRCDDRRQGKK